MDRGLPGAARRLFVAGAGMSVAGWVVYLVLVGTAGGQRLDLWLLPRAGSWGGYEQETALLGPARWVLGVAGNPVLLAAVLGVLLLGGVLAGRAAAAGAGLGVVAVALGVAWVAKAVLPRPDLGVSGSITHNSFPSGHVAAVMAVVAVGLLVVPPAGRWLVAVPGAAGVSVVAGATMVAGWHRLSDVVGSVLLVAAVYCFAAALVELGGAGAHGTTGAGTATSAREVAGGRGVAGVAGIGGILGGLLVGAAVVGRIGGALSGAAGGWPVAVGVGSGVVVLVVVVLVCLSRPGRVAERAVGSRIAVGVGER
ncbi:phosphatase PAP2 family protein [Dactylosporangium sp. AC04546]|uniref:phosphatase PAP2 family protein n=1 Tax=Dactylosporangium sp. AC04546 TaxID=2862460 RepID=UPI002E7B3560|nr:phosphatase PAP2 family protein [Dactylosporangium sp. AC04546]WVK82892.1 phosphatase PAP2 family protein [Dactylosporangium sp. AC04546]